MEDRLQMLEKLDAEKQRALIEKDKPFVPFKYDPKIHNTDRAWAEWEHHHEHNRFHECKESCTHNKKAVPAEVDEDDWILDYNPLNSPLASTSKKATKRRKTDPKQPKAPKAPTKSKKQQK